MRPGQRVALRPELHFGTVVDLPTEDTTRVLVDHLSMPRVYENVDVLDTPEAVEDLITRLMRALGQTNDTERAAVETQLRRLTGHGDLIGFARSLRSAS